jgi:hypothetical protein
VLEVVLPPLATVYILFVAMVMVTLRRSRASPGVQTARGGHVVGTATGGFAAFLLIVMVFHVLIAGDTRAFGNAVVEGGVLALIALALMSALEAWRGRREGDR